MHASKTLDSQRVAIYARFSSERQRETSIDDQVHRCREFINQRGGNAERALVFKDCAISGATMDRPGFERLMEAVERKRIDAIVTEDISRISRDFAGSAHLFKRLQYERISLISVADGIDTSEQGAKLSFTLKSLVADLYLDDLRDKTMRGLEGRARAGFSTGQKTIGYCSEPEYDSTGKLLGHRVKLDPDMAPVVKRIFEMYRDGTSMGGIGRILGREGILTVRTKRRVWSSATIGGILGNQRYIGIWKHRLFQQVNIPGSSKKRTRRRPPSEAMTWEHPHLRIIDDALWNAVQERRKANFEVAKRRRGPTAYLFSGLLRCGLCGAGMILASSKTRVRYYCRNRRLDFSCENKHGIREDVARSGILARLRTMLMDRDIIAYARESIARQLGGIDDNLDQELADQRRKLKRTEARIRRLVEHLADGNNSEYVKASLNDLEATAVDVKATIAELEQRAHAPRELPNVDDVLAAALDLDTFLREDTLAGREYLRRLFKGSTIAMVPQGKTFVARSQVFASVLLSPMARTGASQSNDLAMFGDRMGFATPSVPGSTSAPATPSSSSGS